MPTVQDQLALESEMVDRGIAMFKAAQIKAREQGRLAETTNGRKLLTGLVTELSEVLQAELDVRKAGKQRKAIPLLREVGAETAVFIAMSSLMNVPNSGTNTQYVQFQAVGIATRIEDELRFRRFSKTHSEYYNAVIEDFKRKGTSSYRHKHRVLTFKANEKEDGWIQWSQEDKLAIGLYLIDLILRESDLFQRTTVSRRRGSYYTIDITTAGNEWLAEANNRTALLRPSQYPMIIPPVPWTGSVGGGYHSTPLQMTYAFVKLGRKSDGDLVRRLIDAGEAQPVMDAVNKVQAVPWVINETVLSTVQHVYNNCLGVGLPRAEPYDIPQFLIDGKHRPDILKEDMNEELRASFNEWKREAADAHNLERERVAKGIGFSRAIQTAAKFSQYESIWFPHNCDFRGRIYAAACGLSPQGDDVSKGLLRFSHGKPLGKRGGYWLAVQGANVYGEDKLTFDERAAWVHAHSERIVALGTEPLGNLSFLRGADKPWQFLAFAVEWAGYVASGKSPQFISTLPIAMDGSCNGLQHYSAFLRDPVGAAATNLIASDTPNDIYQRVADVCTRKVASYQGDNQFVYWWQAIVLDRKLAKIPVMTLPYGSTRMTCTDAIVDWLKEYHYTELPSALDRQRHAQALTPLLWASIGEVVEAARVGMDWLQTVTRQAVRSGESIAWQTPLGFPVSQEINKFKTRTIDTQLCGRVQLRMAESTDVLDPVKMANGVAPNFIHSMDSTHLCMTVNAMPSTTQFAMVHDSFGTHACDVDDLHVAIRKAFVAMYSTDQAAAFHRELQAFTKTELDAPPVMGDFNMDSVLTAEYFFA